MRRPRAPRPRRSAARSRDRGLDRERVTQQRLALRVARQRLPGPVAGRPPRSGGTDSRPPSLRVVRASRAGGRSRDAFAPPGNKNGALPILAATVLADRAGRRCRTSRGSATSRRWSQLLADLGADAAWTGPNEVRVDSCRGRRETELDPELCREIRASFLLAGPLLARFGRATVPPPGGDVIGRRRLDTHIHAFAELGVEVELNGGYDLRTDGSARQAHVPRRGVRDGDRERVMAAVLAEGETIVGQRRLRAAHPGSLPVPRGAGRRRSTASGRTSSGSTACRARRRRVPDRPRAHRGRRASSRLAAVTGGDITIEDVEPDDLISIVPAFERLGDPASRSAGRRVRVPPGPGARGPRRPRRPDPEDRGRHLARVPGRPHLDRASSSRRRRGGRCSSSRRCSRAGCSSSTSSSRWARGSSSATRTASSSPARRSSTASGWRARTSAPGWRC